jgi:23S rRNA (adenine2503-C2)-methyltransferase
MMTEMVDLKELSTEGIGRFIDEAGLPRYRAEQLIHWIYKKCAGSISEITEFSRSLRSDLSDTAFISNLTAVRRLKSGDGTEKFLFLLGDGETIESVLIPDGGRMTLCVSSQVGCAMGCRFCRTGTLGLKRNLKAHEIADQVIAVNRMVSPSCVTNIVFMGMGEPLANLDNVSEALRRINGCIGISKRKITLSTAGLVPQLARLAVKAPRVNLAVSLNATTDASRSAIMPVNTRYPIGRLLDACRRFPLSPTRRITFEYVLLKGVNDSPADARRLLVLTRGIRCKVNLIPFNECADSEFRRPADAVVERFHRVLIEGHVTALVRESKGKDILAACGQLRADHSL